MVRSVTYSSRMPSASIWAGVALRRMVRKRTRRWSIVAASRSAVAHVVVALGVVKVRSWRRLHAVCRHIRRRLPLLLHWRWRYEVPRGWRTLLLRWVAWVIILVAVRIHIWT